MSLIFSDNASDAPVQVCSLGHWCQFELIRKARLKQLLWWTADVPLPYASEKTALTTTLECASEILDNQGIIRKTDLPDGAIEVQFYEFYTEIDDWIEDQLS